MMNLYTGRIGSRQQLAENVWLVFLGCSGGLQRYCGDYLHQIQLGFYRKPLLWKIGRFSLYACGNGLNLPHLAEDTFGNNGHQYAKSHAVWQSPSSRTKKLRTSSEKTFFIFRPFLGSTGVFSAVFALLAIFCSWHTLWRFWPHQEG